MEDELRKSYNLFLLSLLSMDIDEIIDLRVLSFDDYKSNFIEEKEK